MRTLLVTLLVMFFAGVHTANALTRAPQRAAAIERSLTADTEMAVMTVLSQPHHLACCEQTDPKAMKAKVANCSVDCASVLPGCLHIPRPAAAAEESRSQPTLTAFLPAPFLQPPINV
ncbi:hypothetical protein [Roseibium sediminicola]|uniref:Uncharacterized protein n=1 Tax=Roseibium sediminicola TaxID=2933272 RepID=A0ABT0H1X5_9HYPH|nr:hypothetical protein [Roseibium sp. CAU 1639]MCK7615695.1 hypothetical protein [Roseibium sp. CAU 1639]